MQKKSGQKIWYGANRTDRTTCGAPAESSYLQSIMTVKDFIFDDGEYAEFRESLTKKRQRRLHHKMHPTNPKMFAIDLLPVVFVFSVSF